MQRLSWDLLKRDWAELFFYDSLSIFISRLHEEKGRDVRGIIIFDPLGRIVPPKKVPLHLAVIYKEDIDFIKDNLRLRRLLDDGTIEPFSYGFEQLKKMVMEKNPFALSIMKGIIIYELPEDLRELDSI